VGLAASLGGQPPEVFVEIFKYVLGKPWWSPENTQLRTLVTTCSLWRSIVFQHPELWSSFNVELYDVTKGYVRLLKCWFQRILATDHVRASLSLIAWMNRPEYSMSMNVLRLIAEILPRCHSLEIDASDYCFGVLERLTENVRLPRLATLHIRLRPYFPYEWDDEDVFVGMEEDTFLDFTPLMGSDRLTGGPGVLEMLYIRDKALTGHLIKQASNLLSVRASHSSLFEGIGHLTKLEKIGVSNPFAHHHLCMLGYLELLGRIPTLQECHMTVIECSEGCSNHSNVPLVVNAPNLSKLTIRPIGSKNVVANLVHLRAPALQELEFLAEDGWAIWEMLRHNPAASQIKRMMINSFSAADADILHSLFSLTPNLVKVEVRSVDHHRGSYPQEAMEEALMKAFVAAAQHTSFGELFLCLGKGVEVHASREGFMSAAQKHALQLGVEETRADIRQWDIHDCCVPAEGARGYRLNDDLTRRILESTLGNVTSMSEELRIECLKDIANTWKRGECAYGCHEWRFIPRIL
jgi:hypothetical protein